MTDLVKKVPVLLCLFNEPTTDGRQVNGPIKIVDGPLTVMAMSEKIGRGHEGATLLIKVESEDFWQNETQLVVYVEEPFKEQWKDHNWGMDLDNVVAEYDEHDEIIITSSRLRGFTLSPTEHIYGTVEPTGVKGS